MPALGGNSLSLPVCCDIFELKLTPQLYFFKLMHKLVAKFVTQITRIVLKQNITCFVFTSVTEAMIVEITCSTHKPEK